MTRMTEDASPGPAAYAGNVGAVRPSSPRVLIGHATRIPTSFDEGVPGPSSYQDLRRMSTISGLHIENSRLASVPSVKMGTSQRGGLFGSGDAPGPGQYNTESGSPSSPRQPTVVFGRDPRTHDSREYSVPGPGAYAVHPEAVSPTSPRVKIGHASRFSPGSGEGVPGPGAYSSTVDSITGHAVSSGRVQSARTRIGTSQRPALSSSSQTPGPSYSPNFGYVMSSSPRSPFALSGRGDNFSSAGAAANPGPGAYAYETHDDSLRHTSPRQRIGTAERFVGVSDGGVPGPGAYTLSPGGKERPPGGALSRAGRSDNNLRLGEGPGVAYATGSSTKAVRPRSAVAVIGTSPRFSRTSLSDTPSPSAYSVNYGAVRPNSAKNSTMARAGRGGGVSRDDNAPGPGAYAVEKLDGVGAASMVSNKSNSPRQSMGRSGRVDYATGGQQSPGPSYLPNVNFVLPSPSGFSMPRGPRQPDFHSDASPGPQDYQNVLGGFSDKVYPASPSVKIGTATRFSEGGLDPVPGPGEYFSAQG